MILPKSKSVCFQQQEIPGCLALSCPVPEQCSCSKRSERAERSEHVWPQIVRNIWPKSDKISPKSGQNEAKSPKAAMLKFGDVSFDLGFERGRMSATGYVAKISMLRLNIGSGKLSSCMLSIGRVLF